MKYSDNKYNLYQQASFNGSDLDQLIMLYDGMINFLRQSVDAFHVERWDQRWSLVNKVVSILNGLSECLDFDKGKGAAPALHQFYHSIELRLLSFQANDRVDLCESAIEELTSMRNAWKEASKHTESAPATAPLAPENTTEHDSSTQVTA